MGDKSPKDKQKQQKQKEREKEQNKKKGPQPVARDANGNPVNPPVAA